jgi:predicted ester cyclase
MLRTIVPMLRKEKGTTRLREMIERAHSAFPDYHEEVQQLVAEGDYVVVRLTTSGRQKGKWGPGPPTGKRVEFEEIAILKIGDGKVVWQRGVVDNLFPCFANWVSFKTPRKKHRAGEATVLAEGQ